MLSKTCLHKCGYFTKEQSEMSYLVTIWCPLSKTLFYFYFNLNTVEMLYD